MSKNNRDWESVARSALNKADPAFNPEEHDRASALNSARRIMGEHGFTYSSLGFSPRDAERIESQTFTGNQESYENVGRGWFASIFGGKSGGRNGSHHKKESGSHKKEDDYGNPGMYDGVGTSGKIPYIYPEEPKETYSNGTRTEPDWYLYGRGEREI
jgi:hypothetical protein